MAQKVNALPDMNREDFTPVPSTGSHDSIVDVKKSDVARMSALPDANQSTVLPGYVVATGDPNQQNGRMVVPAMDRDSGTYKTGQDETPYATPGYPHYGCYDSSKGHDN